jgi:NAD(P)-dependent dehydrogenase (short-subunit alcohol dehydrogenase family)
MDTCVTIVGGSGGIGSAVAARLTAAGRKVALIARDAGRLDATAAATGAVPFVADVLDPTAFAEAIDRIEAEVGEIAGLVHAVGSIIIRPLHAVSLDDFRATLERNVTGAFIAMKTVLPKMMRRRSGSVVLFSTVATAMALPNHEAIAAAKGAVEGLVRTAALSYSRYGIRVNAVAPALTRTPLSASLWQNDKALAVSEAMHPLGRIGQADDIAAAACYFLSADAGWTTGQILGVDGGLSVGMAPPKAGG